MAWICYIHYYLGTDVINPCGHSQIQNEWTNVSLIAIIDELFMGLLFIRSVSA